MSTCEAEFIDGSWYGDDCPECRDSVNQAADDCEECIETHEQQGFGFCTFHGNGCW